MLLNVPPNGLLIKQIKRPDTRLKKHHCLKNTIISTPEKRIDYLGDTVTGGNHPDYGLFKREFPTALDFFSEKIVYVDLGYLGIDKDYKLSGLHIPIKKLPKSKKNPKPTLTKAQKDHNQQVGRARVCVENAICSLKRYYVLTTNYRGKSIKRFDESIEICAGLWNFKLGAIKDRFVSH